MQSGPRKAVTLLLGGARSGKSRYAQELASAFKRVVFVATARRTDSEMRARIKRHREERPRSWKTVEVTTGLDRVVREQSRDADLLLIDCMTFHVANLLGRKPVNAPQFRRHVQDLCDALHASAASVIIVSNEVGSGVVPSYRSGRDYRDLLGEFNQRIAQVADRVILMVAGLPLIIKDLTRNAKPRGRKRGK